MHCKLLTSCPRNVNDTIIQLTIQVWTCNLTSCEWGNYILHATLDPTDCNKWSLKLLSRATSCLVLSYDLEWVSNGLTFRQRVIPSTRWSQSLFHWRNTCRPHCNDSGVKTVSIYWCLFLEFVKFSCDLLTGSSHFFAKIYFYLISLC